MHSRDAPKLSPSRKAKARIVSTLMPKVHSPTKLCSKSSPTTKNVNPIHRRADALSRTFSNENTASCKFNPTPQLLDIEQSKFDAIKKSRSVKTSMQSKRFGKSIIVPPIPPVPLMPFILTEERIKESYHDKSSKLMNKFKRKQNLPTRLGRTSTIIFPSTISQATTTCDGEVVGEI
ncbi:hypothetical protein TSAR_010620 [Trichomalopsis sarcophagae]|uniref:Uncharacterized protein n=1 Tax=Trichomalopsis sarcophagae TaxID=543379 RepID=A0A232F7F9_9HYME|nr:hypothetical protein TSAR_010620 [Trichomalopsis sarcophagae]